MCSYWVGAKFPGLVAVTGGKRSPGFHSPQGTPDSSIFGEIPGIEDNCISSPNS